MSYSRWPVLHKICFVDALYVSNGPVTPELSLVTQSPMLHSQSTSPEVQIIHGEYRGACNLPFPKYPAGGWLEDDSGTKSGLCNPFIRIWSGRFNREMASSYKCTGFLDVWGRALGLTEAEVMTAAKKHMFKDSSGTALTPHSTISHLRVAICIANVLGQCWHNASL